MKIKIEENHVSAGVTAFFTAAAVITFYLLITGVGKITHVFNRAVGVLFPFILGFAIAFLVSPLKDFIERKLKESKVKPSAVRVLSVTLTFLIIIMLFAAFFSFALPEIIGSIYKLIMRVPELVEVVRNATEFLYETFSVDNLPVEVTSAITGSTETFLANLYTIFTDILFRTLEATKSFTLGVTNFLIAIIVSIYMLMGRERFLAQIKKTCYALFPETSVNHGSEMIRECSDIFSGYFAATVLDALIIGGLCLVFCVFAGMPNAMLISIIVGVTNMIPYFGPFIGAIPGILIIFIENPLKSLIFAFFILILQQCDGNIIKPRILGSSTGLSSFWVVFSIILFGELFNFVGMIIGVPTFAVIYLIIRRFVEARLRKKGKPTGTEFYTHPIGEHPTMDFTVKKED